MESSRPTNTSESNDSSKTKTNPPAVITVDTKSAEPAEDSPDGPKESTQEEKNFGQARTPKHANKTRDEESKDSQQKITPDRGEKYRGDNPQTQGSGPVNRPPRSYGGSFAPPRPFEGRQLGGSGAFHPHESRQSNHGDHASYYSGGHHPMQVSPGGGDYRYYGNRNRGVDYSQGGPPGGYNGYEQRNYGEFQGHQRYENGNYHPSGPPPGPPAGQFGAHHHYPNSYNGYPPHDQRGYPQSSTSNHPMYSHGRPPPYPPAAMQAHDYQRHSSTHDARFAEQHRGGGTFSRAVSSSFDKSVKSRGSADDKSNMKQTRDTLEVTERPAQRDDATEPPDDSSWRQLNQVASVDEAVMQERLAKRDQTPRGEQREPESTSSSLTNSPTEGNEDAAKRPTIPTPSKLASLDSLSSVASAQEPMGNTKAKTDPCLPSPGSSAASLDLMKCSSGSSGLLHLPSHHRDMSHGSFPIDYRLVDGKRSRDEQREDVNTTKDSAGDEIRGGPSDYDSKNDGETRRPTKRGRHQPMEADELKPTKKHQDQKEKSSPLSISCSPPQSPSAEKRSENQFSSVHPSSPHHPQPMYPHGKNDGMMTSSPAQMGSSYFEKAPSYTYSMDSAPSFPRDGQRHSYPSLPPRPGSSSSSTITPMGVGPMQVDSHLQGEDHPGGVGPSLPSWEIHAQDSFGAGSVGGGGQLMSSFSFSHDYPMLSGSGSNLGYNGETGSVPGNHNHPTQHGGPPPPTHGHGQHHSSHPPLESRNQSFDGGHYHGSFSRSTDSMDMSYGARPGGPPQPSYQDNYKQQRFPPHAPSWGTTTSTGSHGPPSSFPGPPGAPPHFGQFGGRVGPGPSNHHYPGMMRNYSEDSAVRTSPPPPGPPQHRMVGSQRASFQPPPEFVAPHHPHLNRRPPPAVYLMSSPHSGHHPATKRGTGVFSWTKDDDVRLTEIMKKYKNPRDWEPIAKEHGRGKSPKECHERWIRYLKPGVRKGQWTDHEDAIVIEAVTTSSEQPFTRWSDLAQRLPGRVGKQIRDRWVNHLNPNINHLPFSREDDLLLWEGHKKLGKRWVEISTKFFNSTRSENHIKNRWYSASFKKFIANEFGPDAYSGGKATKKEDKGKKSKSKVESV